MNVIPETEKEWLHDPIEPFSFLKNPIEQMQVLMCMWTEAIVDWGANGGANGGTNTDREGRRKEKEVKRRGEMKEKGERRNRWNEEVSERCESEVIWGLSNLGVSDFWGLSNLGVSDFRKVILVKKILDCWVGKWNRKESEQSFTNKRVLRQKWDRK